MTIEEAIFNRYSIDENKLLKYGFNSDYVYTVDILDNTFKSPYLHMKGKNYNYLLVI